jgi:hypothetical protein
MRALGNIVIRDAAVELGLPWADGTSVYTSSDVNLRQLLAFANAEGQELTREYNWSALQLRLTVNLLPAVTMYALPADFLRAVPVTLWGKSTWMPGYGGPTPSQWEDIRNWQPASTLRIIFRIQGETLELMSPPAAPSDITLVYQTGWWAAAPGAAPSSEELAAETEEAVFDRRLMVAGVKVRYLEARGFDSTAARLDYNRALSRAMGADGVAPVLTVGGTASVMPPTWRNLPPTGWGQ